MNISIFPYVMTILFVLFIGVNHIVVQKLLADDYSVIWQYDADLITLILIFMIVIFYYEHRRQPLLS